MGYSEIGYHAGRNIAHITLNRPDSGNCLSQAMRAELRHALVRAGQEARAILLSAAGADFSRGQELGGAGRALDVDPARLLRDEYQPLLKLMHESPAPIIAAVNGRASGAAAGIALSCDIVIAARSARFAFPETRIGLMPDLGATWLLNRKAGMARALGMCLLGEPVSAEQALAWGLIWEVADDDALAARSGELAAKLAAGPTCALVAARRAIRESAGVSYGEHLTFEAREQEGLSKTSDFKEGLLALSEKRDAEFEGR